MPAAARPIIHPRKRQETQKRAEMEVHSLTGTYAEKAGH